MKSPSELQWWTPLPAPVLWGVMASWIPLSVPAMVGMVCGAAAYVALSSLFDQQSVVELS